MFAFLLDEEIPKEQVFAIAYHTALYLRYRRGLEPGQIPLASADAALLDLSLVHRALQAIEESAGVPICDLSDERAETCLRELDEISTLRIRNSPGYSAEEGQRLVKDLLQ